MKKLLILLFSFSIFAQTPTERVKIISLINKERSKQLFKDLVDEESYQKQLIFNRYKNDSIKPQTIIDGIPIYYSIDNSSSSQTISTNKLYPSSGFGFSLTGLNMFAGVWDGGKVRNSHQELTGKITLGDLAATLSAHATHVTGTIIASGISPLRKGIAYQGKALTFDWDSDLSEMSAFANQGYLVSNHSYGNVASTLPDYVFGQYNTQSKNIDEIAYTYPYYQVVKAAGNDRNDFGIAHVSDKGGYDLLSGYATAKNILTVAAVENVNEYLNQDSVVMSSFSNWGPTDDGRIKPDISAKGVGVNSCISSSNLAYDVYDGTSMASPAITGMVLLLQQYHFSLFSNYMLSASIRGLICHGAKEAGLDPGPDYSFGWGLADAYASANIIKYKNQGSIFDELSLSNNQAFTENFSIDSAQNLKVSISWTDPAGNLNASGDIDNIFPRLKNNLDLKVVKDGVIYYPWKLNPISPWEAATNNSDNNVDNIEIIDIPNAQPGIYTIQVSHKGTLTNGLQDYTLIASGTNGVTLIKSDFNFDKSIFLYPNPTKENLNFTNTDNIVFKNIIVSDIAGKELMNINSGLSNDSINVSNLQSGVYFIKFVSDDKSIVKKFIKE